VVERASIQRHIGVFLASPERFATTTTTIYHGTRILISRISFVVFLQQASVWVFRVSFVPLDASSNTTTTTSSVSGFFFFSFLAGSPLYHTSSAGSWAGEHLLHLQLWLIQGGILRSVLFFFPVSFYYTRGTRSNAPSLGLKSETEFQTLGSFLFSFVSLLDFHLWTTSLRHKRFFLDTPTARALTLWFKPKPTHSLHGRAFFPLALRPASNHFLSCLANDGFTTFTTDIPHDYLDDHFSFLYRTRHGSILLPA
jgi:hypothetical protein